MTDNQNTSMQHNVLRPHDWIYVGSSGHRCILCNILASDAAIPGSQEFSPCAGRIPQTGSSGTCHGDPLTQQQRFRLVEIAHETTDPAILAAAMGLLRGRV